MLNEDGKIEKILNLLIQSALKTLEISLVKWQIITTLNKCLILLKAREVNNIAILTLNIQKHLVLLNKEGNKKERSASKLLQCLQQLQG